MKDWWQQFKIPTIALVQIFIKPKTKNSVNWELTESLSTGTFLHDGGLFSVSRLDRERRFWREFFILAARVSQRRIDARRVKRHEN